MTDDELKAIAERARASFVPYSERHVAASSRFTDEMLAHAAFHEVATPDVVLALIRRAQEAEHTAMVGHQNWKAEVADRQAAEAHAGELRAALEGVMATKVFGAELPECIAARAALASTGGTAKGEWERYQHGAGMAAVIAAAVRALADAGAQGKG